VITNLETLRVLYNSLDFVPMRPIEFQFYAAEEVGFLGSQDIVKSYKQSQVKIFGHMQSDMTGS
jgi:leucyl aminopeptidase